MNTVINNVEYELATTLRVAYKIQGKHNHKAYTEIFSKIGDMCIEEQIDILYAAFEVANPEAAKEITSAVFRDYYLDHYDLKTIMEQMQAVIKGITGDIEDLEPEDKSSTNAPADPQ